MKTAFSVKDLKTGEMHGYKTDEAIFSPRSKSSPKDLTSLAWRRIRPMDLAWVGMWRSRRKRHSLVDGRPRPIAGMSIGRYRRMWRDRGLARLGQRQGQGDEARFLVGGRAAVRCQRRRPLE
jgi:hypothetical protein